MRCAIYTRVSSDGQETTNQLRQLREFAATQGWDVVQEFTDAGLSERRQNGQRSRPCSLQHPNVNLMSCSSGH